MRGWDVRSLALFWVEVTCWQLFFNRNVTLVLPPHPNCGMLKCPLVLLFNAIRSQASEFTWSFQLITAQEHLSEERIWKEGRPAQFYTLTVRVVQKTKNGSMDMDLGVDPRLALRVFAGEAGRVVGEVRRKFGGRATW